MAVFKPSIMKDATPIKAILFDLDGVILDSLDCWLSAVNSTLKTYGLSPVSKEEFIERYWGHSLEENLKKLGLGKDAVEFCCKQQLLFIDRIRPIKPVIEAIKVLKAKSKLKIGLVTNTPRNNTFILLRRFDLENYFDAILTGDDVNERKPSPEIIIKMCKILQVKPSEALLIGDTESDLISGKSAGCEVMIVSKSRIPTMMRSLLQRLAIV